VSEVERETGNRKPETGNAGNAGNAGRPTGAAPIGGACADLGALSPISTGRSHDSFVPGRSHDSFVPGRSHDSFVPGHRLQLSATNLDQLGGTLWNFRFPVSGFRSPVTSITGRTGGR